MFIHTSKPTSALDSNPNQSDEPASAQTLMHWFANKAGVIVNMFLQIKIGSQSTSENIKWMLTYL